MGEIFLPLHSVKEKQVPSRKSFSEVYWEIQCTKVELLRQPTQRASKIHSCVSAVFHGREGSPCVPVAHPVQGSPLLPAECLWLVNSGSLVVQWQRWACQLPGHGTGHDSAPIIVWPYFSCRGILLTTFSWECYYLQSLPITACLSQCSVRKKIGLAMHTSGSLILTLA